MRTNNNFTLRWIKSKQKHEKQIDRAKFYNLMKGVRDDEFSTNVISTQICDLCPTMLAIEINWDRNADNPKSQNILVETTKGSELLTIIYFHKKIWGIFADYCKEE